MISSGTLVGRRINALTNRAPWESKRAYGAPPSSKRANDNKV